MAVQFQDTPQPVDPVETHINNFFDRLIDCLNERRWALLSKAQDTRHEMAARPAARARSEQELIEAKVEVEQRLQMNELRETQLELIAKLEEKLSEVRLPLPETRLMFQGDLEQLEQLIQNVGDVLEEELPVIPRYQDMRKVVQVGTYGHNPGELSRPRGVAIDENSNQIYVAEGNPARVSIFSESGKFLNSFTHGRMEQPWGIAINQNNVYVSDTGVHGVFHFKIGSDISLEAALVGWGSGEGKFNSPRQLTVSENGEVFVSDYWNRRIQILDESLHFQRSIKLNSMQFPRDIKLTNNEIFILTNSSPCVIVFSHAGEKLRSFITCGDGMQVTNPWFFCLEAHNNLIISDYGASKVKVFSPEGTLIHSIGDFIQFCSGLHGVVLTKQLKLVVTADNEPLQLHVYSS